jgi:hypothetical protein
MYTGKPSKQRVEFARAYLIKHTMNNSEIPPSRQQIIDGLNIKSQLKNKVFMQTLEVFNLLKEILHEMSTM